MGRLKNGFTLIEMLIVVAIIGILATIAISQYQNFVAKSQEATTKGNLGSVRSALSIYYGDTESNYPVDSTNLVSLTVGGKYLQTIPFILLPKTSSSFGHATSNSVITTAITGVGGLYYYNGGITQPEWGQVVVNCLHQDMRGIPWSAD